jgi:hypothetical protein
MGEVVDLKLPQGAPADAPVLVPLTLKTCNFVYCMALVTSNDPRAPIPIRADARKVRIAVEDALRNAGFGGLFR